MMIPHYIAGGMGGFRTSGDLVIRMQWAKNMRLNDAKEFVAKKLDLDVFDIADEAIMAEKRRELGIGVPVGEAGAPRGIWAKFNIEKLLGIKINSCEHFRNQLN